MVTLGNIPLVAAVVLIVAATLPASAEQQKDWVGYGPDAHVLKPGTKPDRTKKAHKIRKTPILDANGNNVRIIYDPPKTITGYE